MQIIDRLPSRAIEHFGSEGFTHTRVGRGDLHVSIARLDGVIGGHEAASDQLLAVLQGRVVVSARGSEAELGVWQAVTWQKGEWHETRALEPSVVLILEGDFDE